MEYAIYGLGGFLAWLALFLLPLWKIFGKTGMSPWLSLLMLVPVVGGLVCVLLLAFGRWPAVDGPVGTAR